MLINCLPLVYNYHPHFSFVARPPLANLLMISMNRIHKFWPPQLIFNFQINASTEQQFSKESIIKTYP